MFEQLSFRYPLRKYQRTTLQEIENAPGDGKYHIVAPPGSGRAILGLELIRRFDRPAVIFVPTATTQLAWRNEVRAFLPEGTAELDALVSLSPGHLAPLNIFTYQTLCTVEEADTRVETLARTRWVEEMLQEDRVPNEAAAWAHLRIMEEDSPRRYQRELAHRYRVLEEQLRRAPDSTVGPLLHPDTRQFLDDLLAYGIRSVILDECHHLLDYWTFALHHLIHQIPEPMVVGLAVTPPSPETDRDFENYHSLVGDVDFEVPTPAVIKEGNLAPYQDLVYFVEPSQREMDYLLHIQDAFEEAIGELIGSATFRNWIVQSVVQGPFVKGEPYPWEEFLRKCPLFSVGGLRFLKGIDYPLPPEMLIPNEAREEMDLEDWIALLERYGLDVLKVSSDPRDHQALERMRKILTPFGFNLTDQGVRRMRSPGDMILSFSESKNEAVSEILRAESRAQGERIRSVVVTDFERWSSGMRRLPGVLDPEAGSALRVFTHLATQPDLQNLTMLLVTGRTVLVNSERAPQLLEDLNALLDEEGLQARCYERPTESPHLLEIDGEGVAWNNHTYVHLVTRAFEIGITRCLVGTRGVLGEGWHSPKLNTLIDLTSATSSTSVQELRGRTLRLDPDWPRKLAHHWDVVCVTQRFDKGDRDLLRFVRRHEQHWGIKTTSLQGHTQQRAGQPLQLEERGRIVKGVSHLDSRLAYELGFSSFKKVNFRAYTEQMLERVLTRDSVYDLWSVGDGYQNLSYPVTRLDTSDLRIRTAFTIEQSLKKMRRTYRASLIVGLIFALWWVLSLAWGFGGAQVGLYRALGGVILLGTLLTGALNTRQAYRIARGGLLEQPTDTILLDVGRALVVALREQGLINQELRPEDVHAIEQADNSYDVLLDHAAPQEAALFIEAYQQIFKPVRNQRYLVLRDVSRLPTATLRPLWSWLRRWLRRRDLYGPAYHPVPDVLATQDEHAKRFAHAWEHYVGGGDLVYTYSEEGRAILLKARAQERPAVKGLAFEVWQ